MGKISISSSGDFFIKDGKPYFLMADTDWMAFQKLSLSEFEELVIRRKQQGFNSMQISVLPICHDNSSRENDIHPFALNENGKYEFDKLNVEYFNKARKMLSIMRKYGMVPFLFMFWANYIPDTWAAEYSPGTVIPLENLKSLTRYFIELFSEFDPLYSVSGDTDFRSENTVNYYLAVLDILNELAPKSLTTFHLQPSADPPEVLCEHPQYHFYSYQSGHSFYSNDPIYGQKEMLRSSYLFLNKKVKKPIVNTEPCYEGHGYGHSYGRFDAFDIRKAVWLSLLSGAKAGVSYGAHGVWRMYNYHDSFNNANFSGMPFNWRDALNFDGAWDMGYSKWIFEKYGMFVLKPSCKVVSRSETVTAAESESLIVVYIPYSDEIIINTDLREYETELIALKSKRIISPLYTVKGNETVLHLSLLNEDMLLIARKK